MKWSLPEDRNERKKILIMIGIFAIGIGYGLVVFVVRPHFTAVRQGRIELEEIEDLLWQAERDINTLQRNRQQNRDIIRQILDLSEDKRYILRPSLGNHLLVAESILEQTAEELGLDIQDIRSSSGPPPPVPESGLPAERGFFWPYTVACNFQASLHDVVRYVHRLQQQNPYLAITSLSVTADPDPPPVLHTVTMQIQWPVWSDPEHPSQLAAEILADEEQP